MKVVITVEAFDRSKGYMEYYLAKELARCGHKVFIFTIDSCKGILREKRNEGFEVIRMPRQTLAYGINVLGFKKVAYVAKFIKTEKPDIIHCQPLFSPLSLVFINFNFLSSYKIVGSLITGEYSINSVIASLRYSLAKIIIEHYITNKTSSFFVINDVWKKITLKLFNIADSRMEAIPLGADVELFKTDAKTRNIMRDIFGLSKEDVAVVYSGKIIPSKKLDILFEAIAPIIKQNPKVKVIVVGTGDLVYRKHLDKLVSDLGILNNVIFQSWVHRTKLPDFYNASDIAVWPGSVSISIIEAMSVGLPIIVKRSPITSFAISNGNGFSFKPDNVKELNKYLRKLITNCDLRKKMGENSKFLVEKELNWKNIASQYINVYQSVLNS
jgi:glycosyltransferase involved in cell wall biosynthesis